ncbi:hypothetical protein [Roseicyclus mahoneyensis]|uniref:Uncharacterized protein n=1 Tax=Roseicyclus mahoneyensis TaxID=164332 RepID=A0A316GED2_9RHOB|nr:hypothetical protein [Roseicyclus mahoneyensis]PWK59359.1 hypothetical protein C7455_108127 [Roseicyclus mahoneyensis]
MSARVRDILLFIGAAVAAHLLLIGPLLGLMILTGGAVFALPVLTLILLGAIALDHFVIRPSGRDGWILTAPALGLCANVAFLVLTTNWGTA